MSNLFSKDENLLKSSPYTGAKILELLEANDSDQVSLFEVARKLKKENKASIRSIYYGMIFLYSLDIIDFNEPYLVLK